MDKVSKTDASRARRSGTPTAREERHAPALVHSLTRKPLLLVVLDVLRRANFPFVRIKPDVAKGTSPAQEVPALIQFRSEERRVGKECRL